MKSLNGDVLKGLPHLMGYYAFDSKLVARLIDMKINWYLFECFYRFPSVILL